MRRLLRGDAVAAFDRLQGHGPAGQAGALLHRPAAPGPGLQRGGVPPAFLHQHPAALAAGPSVPDAGPQRRDQHHRRQPPLGPGPWPGVEEPALRRGRTATDRVPAWLRFAEPGQHARAAGVRRHGTDPGAAHPGAAGDPVAGVQGPGPGCVLRVLRPQHRAVGWPGRDRVAGCALCGLHPGPQRPAALALAADLRSPLHRRQRGRGVGGADRAHRAQGQARSGRDDRHRPQARRPARFGGGGPDQPRPRALQAMAAAGPDLPADRTDRPLAGRGAVRREDPAQLPQAVPAQHRGSGTGAAADGRDRAGSHWFDG